MDEPDDPDDDEEESEEEEDESESDKDLRFRLLLGFVGFFSSGFRRLFPSGDLSYDLTLVDRDLDPEDRSEVSRLRDRDLDRDFVRFRSRIKSINFSRCSGSS